MFQQCMEIRFIAESGCRIINQLELSLMLDVAAVEKEKVRLICWRDL